MSWGPNVLLPQICIHFLAIKVHVCIHMSPIFKILGHERSVLSPQDTGEHLFLLFISFHRTTNIPYNAEKKYKINKIWKFHSSNIEQLYKTL